MPRYMGRRPFSPDTAGLEAKSGSPRAPDYQADLDMLDELGEK
jgi:hypothetical protein